MEEVHKSMMPVSMNVLASGSGSGSGGRRFELDHRPQSLGNGSGERVIHYVLQALEDLKRKSAARKSPAAQPALMQQSIGTATATGPATAVAAVTGPGASDGGVGVGVDVGEIPGGGVSGSDYVGVVSVDAEDLDDLGKQLLSIVGLSRSQTTRW
jgi:hypothetical protein